MGDLGSGFAGEVENWFVGSWHEGFGSPAKSKARGRRQWALSLSLSLCVFQKIRFEGKIKTEMTLHPTHGQTEKHFRKMYFPCAIKHLHLRKSISGNHFHPKQTQSQSQFLFYPKYIILPVSPKKHFLQITFNEVPMINNVV